MGVNVDLRTVRCPSCGYDYFVRDFSHACDLTGTTKWLWRCSAYCLDCETVVDGNEAHYCRNHKFGEKTKGYT